MTAPGQKDTHCTGGHSQRRLLDLPGQESPRAEDNSPRAGKCWPVFQAKAANSPAGALLSSGTSASWLKACTARSRAGLSASCPTNAGQKQSVLTSPERAAAELSLPGSRRDLHVCPGTPTGAYAGAAHFPCLVTEGSTHAGGAGEQQGRRSVPSAPGPSPALAAGRGRAISPFPWAAVPSAPQANCQGGVLGVGRDLCGSSRGQRCAEQRRAEGSRGRRAALRSVGPGCSLLCHQS